MRENGTMKLQEAATAFSEALKGLTREGNPLEWANTQYNLGVPLSRVAERGGETTNVKEAIAAYGSAVATLASCRIRIVRGHRRRRRRGGGERGCGRHDRKPARIPLEIARSIRSGR
jgi:hypothetical protein